MAPTSARRTIYIADYEAAERMAVAGAIADRLRDSTASDEVAIVSAPGLPTTAELVEAVRDAEVVCTSVSAIDRQVLDAAPDLRAIFKCGIGVDNIDVAAAAERGLLVARAGDVNFRSVAEFTIGAGIALQRRLISFDAAVRAGGWNGAFRDEWVGRLATLSGSTLGIVGLGSIGSHLAGLARAHEMTIIASDPFVSPAQMRERGVTAVTLEELMVQADVVSINLVLNDDTHHLIDAEQLALMKPSALLVNASRGPVIDEAALVDALRDRRIGGAALDVYEREPIGADHPLTSLDNCLLSPHASGCTELGYHEIGSRVAEILELYLRGRPLPPSCVVSAP